MTAYAMTGVNPALSTHSFQNNGVGDFETPALWWAIMGMGGCLDAPDTLNAGCCSDHWTVQKYIHRA